MNMQLLTFFQCCDNLRHISEELNKPFGWKHIKHKKEFLFLKEELKKKINEFFNDSWTIPYLFETEYTILGYYDQLSDHMRNFYFSNEEKIKESDPKFFIPMNFVGIDKGNIKGNMIRLEIVANNITFIIMDSIGNTFSVSSIDEVQESQKKIVSVCKARFVETLESYLEASSKLEEFSFKRLISDIKSLFSKN